MLGKVKDIKVNSRSVPDLTRGAYAVVNEYLDQLLASVVIQAEAKMTKPRQCHHCHRLLSHPEHIGVGSGRNLCTLDHFDLCPGGQAPSCGSLMKGRRE